MSHHHHSCSEGESIFHIALGVMAGIWLVKILPILIVGVIGLLLWLVFKLVCVAKRVLETSADRMTRSIESAHRLLVRHSSASIAWLVWGLAWLAAFSGFLMLCRAASGG